MRNRTKHLWALALCALFCCALLASCTGAPAQPGPQETGPAVQAGSEYAQTFATGGSPLENANCRALSAAPEGEGCTVTLEFASGSERNGSGESAASHVPMYTLAQTGEPDRVVLTLYGLSFWDYDHSADLSAGEDLFYPAFRLFGAQDDCIHIVFQLKGCAQVSAREEGGSLKLTFVPQEHEQGENYFVVVDGTALFTDGTLSMENGFFPTLCSDGETLATISQPLAGEEEAQQLLNALWESIGTSAVSVVSLAPGELPVAPGDAPDPQIYERPMAVFNGQPAVLEVAMEDGVFLCAAPNNSAMVFARTVQDESGSSSQELWAADETGSVRRLINADFYSVEKAAFSPDGRKLAILENTTTVYYLYVFDVETGRLTNLSEEGLGRTTTDFVWDALGSEIYALSGNNSLSLMKYDFTIADETNRVTLVEDASIEGSGLAYYNGDLYFSTPDSDNISRIYRIKPEGGLREEFAQGDSFAISPDGATMVLTRSIAQGDESEETLFNTSIVLKNMESGEETTVVENEYVISAKWSPDGRLYYTTGSADAEAEYPYALWRCDLQSGETVELAGLRSASFSLSNDGALCYLNYVLVDETTDIRATYLLPLDG